MENSIKLVNALSYTERLNKHMTHEEWHESFFIVLDNDGKEVYRDLTCNYGFVEKESFNLEVESIEKAYIEGAFVYIQTRKFLIMVKAKK